MIENPKSIDVKGDLSKGVDIEKLKLDIKKDLASVKKIVGSMGKEGVDKITQALQYLNPQELQKVSDRLKIAKMQDTVIAQDGLNKTIQAFSEKDDGASLDDLKFV